VNGKSQGEGWIPAFAGMTNFGSESSIPACARMTNLGSESSIPACAGMTIFGGSRSPPATRPIPAPMPEVTVLSSLLRPETGGVRWPRTSRKEVAMKAVPCFAVAILVSSLSGCATDSSLANRASSEDSRYDTVYMAKVEQVSRGRGVHVTWINPPRKKSGEKDD
jgi:hypothetical protein